MHSHMLMQTVHLSALEEYTKLGPKAMLPMWLLRLDFKRIYKSNSNKVCPTQRNGH